MKFLPLLMAAALVIFAGTAVAQDTLQVVLGKVTAKNKFGVLVNCDANVGGLSYGEQTAENGTFHFDRNGMVPPRAERVVFLLDHPRFALLVDGDTVCVLANRTGTYAFEDPSAATRTVAAYRMAPKR